MPGFGGSAERAAIIERNLRLLHTEDLSGRIALTQCTLFVFKKQAELSDDALSTLVPTAAACGCDWVRNAGFWISHVNAFNPRACDMVLLVLDSIDLVSDVTESVDVRLLAEIMSANCLGLVSPSCVNCPSKLLLRPNAAYNTSRSSGRLVEYADVQAHLLTSAVFTCWQEVRRAAPFPLLSPSLRLY